CARRGYGGSRSYWYFDFW
nr:immunoglobulin heavy chain junction region [Macaca mulatta]MOX92602.1 immunoglobulin heavy chain junction region [Macaca mulatta]MOX92841.1 immunoglobulin heavy chain junction region [Macaca mulatta]MOX93127.1 immunoglobulin heavy chain junction region [Macaca mulatta]MOX93138.1 immunoglobulin heavy chain junction region [Macaca mulatta]